MSSQFSGDPPQANCNIFFLRPIGFSEQLDLAHFPLRGTKATEEYPGLHG